VGDALLWAALSEVWRNLWREIMKHMAFVMSLLLSAIAMADRPILLITPKGVYEAEVTNGVPGPWKAAPYDVIVQGFGGGGGTTPVPPGDPPTTGDSQLVSIAKEVLKDKTEATFAAAVIDSLMKAGLKDADLKDALKLTAPIADSAANAEGRIVKFFNQILEVSTDGKAIQAAIVSRRSRSPPVRWIRSGPRLHRLSLRRDRHSTFRRLSS
jgi:hypothetical protein